MEQLSLTLKTPKPKPFRYPKSLKTVGDHIRKKRMDLGLLQRELVEMIGVDKCTIQNWERSHTQPQEVYLTKIVEFLRHNPLEESFETDHSATLGARLRRRRLKLGMTKKCVANKLGVSVDAIRDWERNHASPIIKNINKITEFLGRDYLPDYDNKTYRDANR